MSSLFTKVSERLRSSTPNQHLIRLTFFFIVLGILFWIYCSFFKGSYITTDNAYVSGNIIPISSQESGIVTSVKVNDTEFVRQGSSLVLLDATDRRIALEQAKANLALIIRQTEQLYIKDKGLQATIKARELTLKQASSDLKRRQQAIHIGGVSQEELTHAQDNLSIAQSLLITAEVEQKANQALISRTSVLDHPRVIQGITQVKEAYLALARTTIKAPISGYIAKRSVQVGQSVAPGSTLMAIVALDQLWVDANFKESQLREIKPGQAVELTADVYGSSVVYHGTVLGLSGGTGSVFSLLPAQNATGNWIKVVQRLPVRITLNNDELQKNPLRIGLSMQARINVSKQDKNDNLIADNRQDKTDIYNHLDNASDSIVQQIISQNLMVGFENNSEGVSVGKGINHDHGE